ncbi:MAG: preprotein translocase subunit SecE [Anaerolineae bacterium]
MAAKKKRKKENKLVRYLRETRAEIGKVVWPTRRQTIHLTAIVFGVTAAMSLLLGFLDWVFARLFALLIS